MNASSASQLTLAQQHLQAGRLEQAKTILTRLAASSPQDLGVNNTLAVVLARLMEHERARYFAEKAVAIDPASPAARVNLGNILYFLGDFAGALRHFEAGLAADAAHLGCLRGRAKALLVLARPSEAESAAGAGLERHAGDRDLRVVLADAALELGRPERALELRRALAQERPGDADLLRGLAFTMNYAPGVDPPAVLDAHRAAAAATVAGLTIPPPPRPRGPEGRRLVVGVLSSDLREHSVARFAAAVVAGLDPEGFSVACYSASPGGDATTAFFKRHASVFREVFGKPPAAVASQIRADGVDVLLELGGLTHGQHLPVLALRPAPLVVTAIGYPNTTGLPSVHLRLVDSLTDPPAPDPAGEPMTERPLRLDPCFLCYTPPDGTPEPGPRAGGPVTFGSFNAGAKLNDGVIELWASIVSGVPGARLLLKNRTLGDAGAREQIRSRFERAGLRGESLELVGQTPSPADHLAMYARVDVALDPFPYHGTTTTCEALWMGVPVVTLAGPQTPGRHASRVGVSLLSAAGVPEWIGGSREEYALIAAGLASDPGGLELLRRTLRARVGASALCDRGSYARRLGAALAREFRALVEHHA